MRRILKIVISILLLSNLSACSIQEPEGPGEQIGKGIDMIAKGLEGMDRSDTSLSREERSRIEKEKEDLRRKREEYEDLERDLNNERESRRLDDSSSQEEWSSKRRY